MGNLITEYNTNTSGSLPEFDEEYQYNVVETNIDDELYNVKIYSEYPLTFISFEGNNNIIELNYIETKDLTSTYNLFYNCKNLTYVDLRGCDFSNVETIERMFTYCSNLEKIDGLNDIDISNVNNMGGLFSDCSKIQELDVKDWDVSKVTNFGAVFRRCPMLTKIDVSKWDTSNGIIMSGIFTNCSGLIELDVSSWIVGKADTISQMFYGCSKLTKLTLFKYIDPNVVTTYLFGKCDKLKNVISINSDYNTINILAKELPTKKASDYGIFDIEGVDNISLVDIELIKSKFWNGYDWAISKPRAKTYNNNCGIKHKGSNIAIISFCKRKI